MCCVVVAHGLLLCLLIARSNAGGRVSWVAWLRIRNEGKAAVPWWKQQQHTAAANMTTYLLYTSQENVHGEHKAMMGIVHGQRKQYIHSEKQCNRLHTRQNNKACGRILAYVPSVKSASPLVAPLADFKLGPRGALVLDHTTSQITPQIAGLGGIKGIGLKPDRVELFPCQHLPLAEALERAAVFALVQGTTRGRRGLLHLDGCLDPKDAGPGKRCIGNPGGRRAWGADVQVGTVVKLLGVGCARCAACLQDL